MRNTARVTIELSLVAVDAVGVAQQIIVGEIPPPQQPPVASPIIDMDELVTPEDAAVRLGPGPVFTLERTVDGSLPEAAPEAAAAQAPKQSRFYTPRGAVPKPLY